MSSRRPTSTRGFGYQPEHSAGYHFELRPTSEGGVRLFERYEVESGEDVESPAVEPQLRAEVNPHRWQLVKGAVANEFNARLKQAQVRPGRWLKGPTPLAPHFGKELALLFWAVEDQDPTVIPRMLANWRGLAPEERWWFYTTINAARRSRGSDPKYGWKAAIKVAFLADPQDVGLESLRISTEVPEKSKKRPEGQGRTGAREPTQSEDASSMAQGRLFADPSVPK